MIVVSPSKRDDIHVNSSFSPDAQFLAVMYETGRLSRRGAIYRTSSRTKVCTLQNPGIFPLIESYEWSHDGKRILSRYTDYSKFPSLTVDGFAVWDTRSGKLVANVHCAPVQGELDLHLADGADTRTNPPIKLRDAASGSITHVYDKLFRWRIQKGDQNQHHGRFLLDSSDGLKIRDYKTRILLWKSPPGGIAKTAWAPGEVLGAQREVQYMGHFVMWDGKTKKEILTPLSNQNFDFSFQPHSTFVLLSYIPPNQNATGSNTRLMLWDYVRNQVLWDISTGAICLDFKWSTDGKWFVTKQNVGGPYKICLYDKVGYAYLARVSNSYPSGNFSSDGNTLAFGYDGQIEIVDLRKYQ